MQAAENAWRSHAACKPRIRATPEEVRANSDIFFHKPVEAKEICAGCVSRIECLSWAQRFDYQCILEGRSIDMLSGVWGGMDRGERWSLLRGWT